MPNVNQEVAAIQAAYKRAKDSGVTSLSEFAKAGAAMLRQLGEAIQAEAASSSAGDRFRTLGIGYEAVGEASMAYANMGRAQEAALLLMYAPKVAAGRWPEPNPPEWLGTSTLTEAPLPGAVKAYAAQRVQAYIRQGMTPPESVYIEVVKQWAPGIIAPGVVGIQELGGWDSLADLAADVHGAAAAVTSPWWSNPIVLFGALGLGAYALGRFS